MKNYRAVTMIEMIIVIAIIGIMAGLVMVSLQSGRSSSRLQSAQRNVTATIKLAQSYALQGKTQGGVTPCGYGFRFTANNAYEIFYNPRTGGYTSCNEQNNVLNMADLQYNGTSQTAEFYTLDAGVTLNSPVVTDFTASSADNATEIYFTIPHANAFKKDGTKYDAETNLRFIFSGDTKDITIRIGGYVSE